MIAHDPFLDFNAPAARPASKPQPPSFPTQLRAVQAAGEDFEWYPTTDEIIAALKKDLGRELRGNDRSYGYGRNQWKFGFLDVGAGNGKVINAMRTLENIQSVYAIEKSHALIEMMDKEILILGCDFWHTSLMDKEIGFIFSNPPYSRFEEWSLKILREAPAHAIIWLVIPQRWEKSAAIQREIEARKGTQKIVGTFDFADAEDRKARAKVHLLKITLPAPANRHDDIEGEDSRDPFTRFFDETFSFATEEEDTRSFDEKIEETQVVRRLNFIEALCHLYEARMAELQRNYQAICAISPSILAEFQISRPGLIESLKMKLATAKKEYWERLFSGMAEINTRLTRKSRNRIQEKMQSQTGIDFNRDNCYAIVLWVVKNANGYFDDQLCETYEYLVGSANVENYVSNKRVFKTQRFRYEAARDENATHFRLKVGHRMVLTNVGGLKRSEWSSDRSGIDDKACEFIGDLITVANNLGFTVLDHAPREHQWKDSTAQVIRFRTAAGKVESLIRIRPFLNWNMHMQFHPDFIHALNVQHGKLKGWLRNDDEAATELEIPLEVAARHFASQFRLAGNALRLMAPAE